MNFSKFETNSILYQVAEAPIKERLKFVTDVIETFNGKEDRSQMRKLPSRTFDYTVNISSNVSADSFLQFENNIRNDFAIPIWTEACVVKNISKGIRSFTSEALSKLCEVGSSLFIYTFCERNWIACEITAIDGDLITTNAIFEKNIRNSYIMPLQRAWLRGDAKKLTNGHSSSMSLTFEIYDPQAVPEERTDVVFGNIFRNLPTELSEGATSRSNKMRQDITDFDTGLAEWRTTWEMSKYEQALAVKMFGIGDITSLKKMLYSQRGRFKPFYIPTFENNLTVVRGGIVGRELRVKNITYDILKNPIVKIVGKNSSEIVRIIDTIQTDREVTLITSKFVNINSTDITAIYFLKLVRFDSDTFTITHNSGGFSEFSTVLVEVFE